MPSHRASHYGPEFEKWLAERRNLQYEGVHTSWCDLEFQNGTPVEAKAAMTGTGYFQVYENQHVQLEQANGWYGFGVYRPRGNDSGGIRVLKAVMKRAVDVPTPQWSNTGTDRGRKLKLPISDVFG